MTKGEQLTEKFFVEVKGWKKINTGTGWKYSYWVDPNGKRYSSILPPLHTSLDLQEEWLWPELREVKIYSSKFVYYDMNKGFVNCHLEKANLFPGVTTMARAETKALAQLTAGLKALNKKPLEV